MPEVRETFASIDAYLRARGVDPTSALSDESTTILQYSLAVPDLDQGMIDARSLVKCGGAFTFHLDLGDTTIELASQADQQDMWNIDGDLSAIGWPLDLPGEGVSTKAFLDRWNGAGLTGSVTAEVLFQKEPWIQPIQAQTPKVVWLGPRLAGFSRWLSDRPPVALLSTLLGGSGALVLLGDWVDAPLHLGTNLTLGSLEYLDQEEGDDATWPMESEPWQRRSITIDPAKAPASIARALARAVGWGAVTLLAVKLDSNEARPDLNSPTAWRLPKIDLVEPAGVNGILRLSQWVAKEPNATRLSVARAVASTRIIDPFHTPEGKTVAEAAEISYRQTVDATVQSSLRNQIELEQNLRDMDSELTKLRVGLAELLDQTVLRFAAGGVVIAAAVVATKDKSPLLVHVGGLLIAAYVTFTATIQLGMVRRDIKDRIAGFEAVISARGWGLDGPAQTTLESWAKQLRVRVQWIRWLLLSLAVAIAIVSYVVV